MIVNRAGARTREPGHREIVVFLCLAALYESWSTPVAILMAAPLGIVGAVGYDAGRLVGSRGYSCLTSIRLPKAQQELVGVTADSRVEHILGVIIVLVCEN
jgi:hypothetical protein